MPNFKFHISKIKKILFVLFVFLFISIGLGKSAVAITESKELRKCVVITHCVLNNWSTNNVEKSFKEAYEIVKNTPRTKIIKEDKDYIHAEATTRWMHYIDDLEIKALPKLSIIQIRSESRVGIGDNGVNKNRVAKIKSKMNYIND